MSRRAFTLIELLVVISIVALLSGVVMASLNSAREKGRIAAARHFDASLYHALGSYATGKWSIEDGPGATSITDLSGNGNTGSISNATWSTDTYNPNSDYSLSFNGTNAYVTLPASNRLVQGDSSFTLSAWFKPAGSVVTAGNADLGGRIITLVRSAGSSKVSIGIRGDGTDSLQVFYNGTIAASLVYPNSGSLDGRWHHMAASYDKNTRILSLYYDGKLGTSANVGVISDSSSDLARIGLGPDTGGGYWYGLLDDIGVYSISLSLTEIERMYAQGENKYLALDRGE